MALRKTISQLILLFFAIATSIFFLFSLPLVDNTYYKLQPFYPLRILRMFVGLTSVILWTLYTFRLSGRLNRIIMLPLYSIFTLYIILESVFTLVPFYTQNHYSPLSKNYLHQHWKLNADGIRDKEMIDYFNPNLETIIVIGDEFTLGLGLKSNYSRFVDIIRNKLKGCYNVVLLGKIRGNANTAYSMIQNIPIFPSAVLYIHSADDILDNFGDGEIIPEIQATPQALDDNSYLMDYVNEFQPHNFKSYLDTLSWYYNQSDLSNLHKNKLGGIIHYSQFKDYRLGVVLVPLIRNNEVLEYSDSTMIKPISNFLSYNATPKLNLTSTIKAVSKNKRKASKYSNYPSVYLHQKIADSIIRFLQQKSMIDGSCIQ